MVKKDSIGKRLVEAFGTNDKAVIARKLGFASVQAVYKLINGERELDYERLVLFQNSTKRSIDWLLTGELPDSANTVEVNKLLHEKLRIIAHEQSLIIHGDAEIAGPNIEAVTLRLLTEYLLDEALLSHNLITKPLIDARAQKRAAKFSFVADRELSIEQQFRKIIVEELDNRLRPGDDEDVTIEDAEVMLAPVVAHIGPGKTIGDKEIKELEKRLGSKKRKTG